MIKTKEVYTSGFYIFESKAAANSNYIENLKEAKQLLVYARYYLKSYLKIHDYIITRDGWQFAVQIEKNLGNHDSDEMIWKIISERIRLWLSTYVKRVNFWRNRKGVLVRDNYRKYYFDKVEDALDHLGKMRKQRVKLYAKNKKYRGVKKHYRIDKILERGSIFLCSKELYEKGRGVMEDVGSELFSRFQNVVGGKLLISTIKKHIVQDYSNFSQDSG